MIKHGGELAGAVSSYGIERSKWIDLSTGVNPNGYDIEGLPQSCFHRLPEPQDLIDLEVVARASYKVKDGAALISAPGSEFLIHALPQIRSYSKVAILSPTFSSHEEAWLRSGHDVRIIDSIDSVEDHDVVVVVNPNNPCGMITDPKRFKALSHKLEERGGLLVIDEAFADIDPDISFLPYHDKKNVIVLRSIGKFYGVAGVRLGFAIGDHRHLEGLRRILGAWAVSGPAIEVGKRVLLDESWAVTMRAVLNRQCLQHKELYQAKGLKLVGGTSLFCLLELPDARTLHVQLAKRGVWTRVFDYDQRWMRLGLCKSQNELSRFASCLDEALRAIEIAA